MSGALRDAIATGIDALQLCPPPDCAARLEAYLHLLAKWNRVYSLTAVRDPRDMVSLHLMDCLAILPLVQGPRLLDIGTGPGLPGIPLALAAPQLRVSLLDSNQKKTRFLTQALLELSIVNAEVITARAEGYSALAGFDTVASRAFGSLTEFVQTAAHLCTPGGRMLAMKGQTPREEIAALPPGFVAHAVTPLTPPGVRGSRCVVTLVRTPT